MYRKVSCFPISIIKAICRNNVICLDKKYVEKNRFFESKKVDGPLNIQNFKCFQDMKKISIRQ